MKITLSLLLSLVVFSFLKGQEIDIQVISSSGGSYQSQDFSLDWTMGEVAIASLEASSILLSQGFQQPDYILVSVNPLSENIGNLLVFPNPFSQDLHIKMSCFNNEKGQFQLYTTNGTLIWEKSFDGTEIIESYSAQTLPAGAYTFVVTFSDQSIPYSYSLLKIQ